MGSELICNNESGTSTYIVSENDQLGKIIFNLSLRPIWGKNSVVEKTWRLNSATIKDPNKIKPGMRILIPNSCSEIVERDSESPSPQVVLKVRKIAEVTSVPPEKSASVSLYEESSESRLKFSLGTGYSRIDSQTISNGAQALFLSKPSTSVRFAWEQVWSENFESFIQWDYQSLYYLDASLGTVYNGQQSFSSISLGGNYFFSPNWKAGFHFGYRGNVYASSYVQGTANLETRDIPFVKLFLAKDLVHVKSLKLSTHLSYAALSGSSAAAYDVKPGQEYLLGLSLSQKLKNYDLFADAEYAETRQNTSLATQSKKDIYTRMGIVIPLSSGSEK